MTPTIDDFELPDIVVEQFRQRMNERDDQQFSDGYFLVDVVDEYWRYFTHNTPKDEVPKIMRKVRARIIRQIADKVGVDPATLRDRESMARFYPPAVRDEFEELTYYQLRACKSAGVHWREYAEWVKANLPIPLSDIWRLVKNNGDVPPVWLGRASRILHLAQALVYDQDAPDALVRAGRWISTYITTACPHLAEREGYGD